MLALVVMSSNAFAAEPSAEDVKAADQLFNEGRALMDSGSLAEACPKL